MHNTAKVNKWQLSFKFESCLSRRSTKSCLSKLNCFLVLLIHQDSFQYNLNWTKFVHSFGRIIWHHRSSWGIWNRLCQPVQTGEWAVHLFMLAVRNTYNLFSRSMNPFKRVRKPFAKPLVYIFPWKVTINLTFKNWSLLHMV